MSSSFFFYRHHRALKRAQAWLALVAMLLLYLAPVGARLHAAVTTPQTSQSEMAFCHEMTGAASPAHTSSSSSSSGLMDACGYCSLLAHLSGLTVNLPLPELDLPVAIAPEVEPCWQTPTEARPACVFARAPPALG